MFRLTKLTDYGIVLLTHFAQHPEREHNARELAEETRLPLPTVGKLLKELVKEDLLVSHRGTKGGYRLARRPGEISVADVITALEGPIAVTECNNGIEGSCEHESCCPVRSNWHVINRVIHEALGSLTLQEMSSPLGPRLWGLTTRPSASLASLTRSPIS